MAVVWNHPDDLRHDSVCAWDGLDFVGDFFSEPSTARRRIGSVSVLLGSLPVLRHLHRICYHNALSVTQYISF